MHFWHLFGNIYKFSLYQWLSATNKKSVCRSDSVQQTILKKYPISLWHVPKELKKKTRKKTYFHIWISPPLSNCFGVPYFFVVYYCGLWLGCVASGKRQPAGGTPIVQNSSVYYTVLHCITLYYTVLHRRGGILHFSTEEECRVHQAHYCSASRWGGWPLSAQAVGQCNVLCCGTAQFQAITVKC